MSDEMSPDTSSYFVDPETGAEMSRLMIQDRLVTQAMGGPLPERHDVEQMHTILDVACGPGGWVIEIARLYPHVQVVGVDISQRAMNYASLHAQERKLSNVKFRYMDVRQPLDFPDHTFDLVNARFLVAFLPRASWPNLLAECVRILRPGGILRLTECEVNFTTSTALNTMLGYFTQAMKRADLGFSLDGSQHNITPMLARLLRNAGCRDIARVAHVIDISAGEEAHGGFYENMVSGLLLARPFLVQMGVATQEEVDRICQQTLPQEMMDPDFNALWFLLTVWGSTPMSQ
ncbi:MAG TPA: methyltransferase domain-containing protein [Ktedonobacteraceae bacterium]